MPVDTEELPPEGGADDAPDLSTEEIVLEALQDAFNETAPAPGYVTGYIVIAEVVREDGPVLRIINEPGDRPWLIAGFMSALSEWAADGRAKTFINPVYTISLDEDEDDE